VKGTPRFRDPRPYARGGLGEVFVAHDTELNREVALKEIQERYADDPESRTRFLLEAEITGGLEHPGIVPVYGLGCYPDGRPFYAMRFIKGDSLKDAIARLHAPGPRRRRPTERNLQLRELLGRFVDVCNAVAYAHSRGVLHRDLKPGNVMLGPFGETLVVDWGLAKVVGRPGAEDGSAEGTLRPVTAGDSVPTQFGSVVGTPAYMSPEQASGRLDRMGPTSDIYSLGATLYTLLSGYSPFPGGDQAAVLAKVRQGDFSPPSMVRRGVPAALEAVCLKAMALKPENRYPTAKALAEDVENWLADEPVSAWQEEPWHLRAGRWARHRPALVASVVGALVTVLVGGLAFGVRAWWAGRQAWSVERQRMKDEEAVKAALVDVDRLKAALVDVDRLQGQARWREARAALEEAQQRLGDSSSGAIKASLDHARSNMELLIQLDSIHLKRATLGEKGNQLHAEEADREYEKAFRDAGMPVAGRDPDATAAWVTDSGFREQLLVALDDWALCAATPERRAWPLMLARGVETDPWSHAMRDPAVWEDRVALTRTARGDWGDGPRPDVREGSMSRSAHLMAVLGERLMMLGADGELLLRSAQKSRPTDFWITFTLANALFSKGKAEEAVGYYQAALALRPGTTAVFHNLNNAMTLTFAKKVAATLKGEYRPADAIEQLRLADWCRAKERYALAARFYSEAFAARPELAVDLLSPDGTPRLAPPRYVAACSAAMAGCGEDEALANLDEKDRLRLRKQAVDWLRAELFSMQGIPATRGDWQTTLRSWQKDPTLAGVREAAALEKLPPAERADWQKLWADVAALIEKAGAGGKP
jgi:tetratricopeptide (TPR) repeat protein/tRNA A-37 threonylcarbamoyl transferase component Bud32